MKHLICCIVLFALMISMTACCNHTLKNDPTDFAYPYGVFLGIDDLTPCKNYQTVVLDAQYFSAIILKPTENWALKSIFWSTHAMKR